MLRETHVEPGLPGHRVVGPTEGPSFPGASGAWRVPGLAIAWTHQALFSSGTSPWPRRPGGLTDPPESPEVSMLCAQSPEVTQWLLIIQTPRSWCHLLATTLSMLPRLVAAVSQSKH